MATNSSFEGQQYSFVDDLAQTVPELKELLAKASAGGWTPDRFAAAMQGTAWWRDHSDTARQMIGDQASDPASYQQKINNAQSHVQQIANQMGVTLNAAQVKQWATADLFQGLDDATLQQNIGQLYKPGNGVGVGGKSVDLTQQITAMASDYGVPVTQAWINNWVKSDLTTGNGLEGAKQSLINSAKSTYPGLKDQLNAGQTVKDVAQPYIASMAQTLEIPETQITMKDLTIQKALQTQTAQDQVTTGAKASTDTGSPAITPLWQFQQQLRADPRWDKTDNAKQSAYSMVAGLGKSFGFAS